MKSIYSIMLLSTMLILFASCEKNAPTAQLTFEHLADGIPLQDGTLHRVGADEQIATFSSAQFYVSDLRMIKTGGEEFAVDGTFYIDLENTSIDLGEIDVDSYTSIKFNVGVDSSENHLDIATLPDNDPLSYQSPSMYWDWTGGYRFISLNGYYDGNGDQLVTNADSLLQLHIGNDAYLREATVSYSLEAAEDETYDLNIKVDYADLFNYDIVDFPITKTGMVTDRHTAIANEIPSIFSR